MLLKTHNNQIEDLNEVQLSENEDSCSERQSERKNLIAFEEQKRLKLDYRPPSAQNF